MQRVAPGNPVWTDGRFSFGGIDMGSGRLFGGFHRRNELIFFSRKLLRIVVIWATLRYCLCFVWTQEFLLKIMAEVRLKRSHRRLMKLHYEGLP